MLSVTRRLQWCMGHRLVGHEGHCAMLHGHNYVGLFTARVRDEFTQEGAREGSELDGVGRVVDFAVLKERVGGWIGEFWDHGFVLNDADEPGLAALNRFALEVERETGDQETMWQKSCVVPFNPTAENLALHLLNEVCPRVLEGTAVEVFRVELWETENCRAEVAL